MKSYSMMIPGDPAAVQLLRALLGAPISCLIALHLAHPHPLGQKQLKYMTGYKDKGTISDAMTLLCDVYFFAARVTRFVGWCLTDKGVQQMQLPVFAALLDNLLTRAPGEGDFSTLAAGSCSGFISISDEALGDLETTTTTAHEGGKIPLVKKSEPLPKEASELIEFYLRGCKRAVAEHAVRTALARGDTLAEIEIEMISWVIYAESPAGKGIRSASIHAVSKIKDAEKCPDFLFRINRKDKHDGDAWRAWEEANRSWIERLKELDGDMPASAQIVESTAHDAATTAPAVTPADPPPTDVRAANIWQAALGELQLQMTKATFDTWVKPTFALSYEEEPARLTVGVRNAYSKQWLENRLYGMIERTVNHVLGKPPQEIKFVLQTREDTSDA